MSITQTLTEWFVVLFINTNTFLKLFFMYMIELFLFVVYLETSMRTVGCLAADGSARDAPRAEKPFSQSVRSTWKPLNTALCYKYPKRTICIIRIWSSSMSLPERSTTEHAPWAQRNSRERKSTETSHSGSSVSNFHRNECSIPFSFTHPCL